MLCKGLYSGTGLPFCFHIPSCLGLSQGFIGSWSGLYPFSLVPGVFSLCLGFGVRVEGFPISELAVAGTSAWRLPRLCC